MNLWSFNTKENLPRNPLSPANFLDFQKMNTTLDGLEGYFTFVTPTQMQTDAGTEIAYSLFVTPNMFNMLGRSAALGRVVRDRRRAPASSCSATATGAAASAPIRTSSARR